MGTYSINYGFAWFCHVQAATFCPCRPGGQAVRREKEYCKEYCVLIYDIWMFPSGCLHVCNASIRCWTNVDRWIWKDARYIGAFYVRYLVTNCVAWCANDASRFDDRSGMMIYARLTYYSYHTWRSDDFILQCTASVHCSNWSTAGIKLLQRPACM